MVEVTEEEFKAFLDDHYTISIGQWSCPASRVLKEVDPTAYNEAFSEYESIREDEE